METQTDFQLSSYDYQLPAELIAQHPVSPRHASRLLVGNFSEIGWKDTEFKKLADHLPSDSLVVFNQTKVLPCRLLGQKSSGGRCEVLLTNPIPGQTRSIAMLKCSGKKSVGMRLQLGQVSRESTLSKILQNGLFELTWQEPLDLMWLEDNASIPLPPYIREGIAEEADKAHYQTIYAHDEGSCAAPTAGLHFTEEVFEALQKKGIQTAALTLHVGPGTFKPVQSENIREHSMHKEWFAISKENAEKISKYWGKIICVGTTSLRALESHADEKGNFLGATKGKETDIFLYPGKTLFSSRGLITNFHLPKSSLLMLVSAFTSREFIKETYVRAIKERYRFYSYGDASLLLR